MTSARIGDIVELVRESVSIDPAARYEPIGVRSFAKGLIRYPVCTGDSLSKMRYFKLPPGSLVISNIKAWEGAVALASPDEGGRVVSNRFLTYLPIDKNIEIRYLWHYFASDPGARKLAESSPGSADRNRTLGIRSFEDLVIPLPTIDEQRAISTQLDAVAEVSRAMAASTANLASTLSGIRQQILQAAANRCVQITADDIFTQVHRRVDVRSNESYEMLGVRSFARGAFASGVLAGADTSYAQLRIVDAGDLVYPKLMAWEGAFAIVPQELDGRHVSPEFCIFKITDARADPEYLRHLFAWPEFLASVSGRATGTNVRRRRLQSGDFLKAKLPLPEISEQRDIAVKLNVISGAADTRTRQTALALALPRAARNEVFAKLV